MGRTAGVHRCGTGARLVPLSSSPELYRETPGVRRQQLRVVCELLPIATPSRLCDRPLVCVEIREDVALITDRVCRRGVRA
jgi:hypothetical protein